MLLVRDSMTRKAVSVKSSTTATLAVCRERAVRHVQLLKGGELVETVSDRDLCSAATAPGDAGCAAALEEIAGHEVQWSSNS